MPKKKYYNQHQKPPSKSIGFGTNPDPLPEAKVIPEIQAYDQVEEEVPIERVFFVQSVPPMLNLRAVPNLVGEILTVLPKGTRMRILESRDSWSQVAVLNSDGKVTADSRVGFVRSEYLEME